MKKWLKIALTIIVFIGLTVSLYFIGFQGDWIKPIVERAGLWGYLVYLVFQIIITTLLCFVPATTFTFTLMGVQIFGLVGGLIISIIGCWISSMVMFAVGRYGGVKLVDWLVGKEDREKAQKLVSDRATVLVPVMLACPFFPDDALCMISGMTDMNFWYFSIMSLFTRSIGISGTALLGNNATINYIKNALGDNIVLWVIAVNILLVDIYAIWKLSGTVERLLKKHREKKKQQLDAAKSDDNNSEYIENIEENIGEFDEDSK